MSALPRPDPALVDYSDGYGVRHRHTQALGQRRIVIEENPDGTFEIIREDYSGLGWVAVEQMHTPRAGTAVERARAFVHSCGGDV